MPVKVACGGSIPSRRQIDKLRDSFAPWNSRAQSFLNDPSHEPGEAKKAPAAREIDIHVRAITNRLREHLATHVSIQHSSKKGKIEIEYYGDDDLQRLIELLGLPSDD